MSSQHAPLLSLCIPTWNRASLLADLLENLRREIRGLEDRVEIVVADNASEDNTSQVVHESGLYITYGRQSVTVGMASNILFATCEIASGKFIWIIGDDDLILPGGLRRVIDSIECEPDLNYHYINFGWVDINQRHKIIFQRNGHPPAGTLKSLQFNLLEWKRLDRGEALAYLPSYNPSSLFAGIFCYATRREFFLEARSTIHPTDAFLDGSSNLLDDSFPHAMITVPKIIGNPIAYIGVPCMLQGINGWEWGRHSHKTMLLGQHELMLWLKKKGFDPAALRYLRTSLTQTIGRLFARMQLYKDKHFGIDILLDKVIPFYINDPDFWHTYTEEVKTQIEIEMETRFLVSLFSAVDSEGKKIGLLGTRGRGEKILTGCPDLCRRLKWIGDEDDLVVGHHHEGCLVNVSHASTFCDADIDILILGLRSSSSLKVLDHYLKYLNPGGKLITVSGIHEKC
jgi:glycosyltransferase involved in cell wall biosynthesis